MSKKTEIRIPWGSGIVGHVASSAKSVNISDCYASEKFNPVSHQFRIFFPLRGHPDMTSVVDSIRGRGHPKVDYRSKLLETNNS